MTRITLASGLGAICPKTGRIILAPHRRKRAFEVQMRRSGWVYGNRLWKTGKSAPDWHPYEPLPMDVEPGLILRVYVAVERDGSNEIAHVHWYDNKRAAQRHFESHGLRIADQKLRDSLWGAAKKLIGL